MKTHFLPDTGIGNWARHRAAGDAWLDSFYDLGEVGNGWGVFFVEPYALATSLELFVKALVGFDNPSFNAKSAGHSTEAIIKANTQIAILGAIAADFELMELVKEYGKAKDFKYGELGMVIDRDEKMQVLDAVLRIRTDLETRVEVRRPSAEAITAAIPCPICNARMGDACTMDDASGPSHPTKIHTARIPPGWTNPSS